MSSPAQIDEPTSTMGEPKTHYFLRLTYHVTAPQLNAGQPNIVETWHSTHAFPATKAALDRWGHPSEGKEGAHLCQACMARWNGSKVTLL